MYFSKDADAGPPTSNHAGSTGAGPRQCAMQEIQVWSLGQEDPLEKGFATYSSILAWRIPWTEEPCRGPAPVDPGNSKVGTVSASLEKYIFNYRYRERLEMDSAVGELVEKRRLNLDGNSARETGARKKQHGGISLSGNWSDFFIFGFAYIPFVTYRDEYRVTRGVISPDLYQNQVLHINV